MASAQAAAIRPATERTRAAAIQTVANLDAAKDKTGQFNKNEFREKLRKAIDATMQKPKTESEAKEVMKTGAKNASGLLKGEVTTQNQAVSGELQSATTDVPVSDQPQMKEVGLTPEPLGAPPAPVTTEAAVPPPLPAEQLDYSSDRAPTDKAMADAGVTKEQLEQGNEPEFKANLAARTDAEKHEVAAEQSYRKTEVGIREQTEHSAQTVVSHGLTNIHAARVAKIGKVVDQQNATREKHAAEHQRITDEINKIKNATRKDVNDVLTAMEKEAGDIFEKGLSDAEKAYEATFKEEKGGTWTWLTTWGSDWEDLIERSLATARGIYRVTVYQAIDRVADFVDAKLEEAKRKVSEGRSKVESFVKGLDDSVRGFGETALKAVSADFDQMSGEIDQRRDSLVDKLTQQYKASYERMSAMEEKLREENKSLWQRIYDATVGLIKKILAFKDMLLNVLARAADAIGSIIAHPISFLGNLVDAGKLGFSNFVDHIGEHLKQGFMEWLFGAVAETGIQLPKNFDLAGILSLVLQVLGLTYSNIRSRAVKILGEKVVKALETAAEIFKILITKGPAGLWEYIKEKLGDLKAMVIDKIKSFIMEKVIMAGVTWIIGLLNPASAFFKACKAIYDIVMFFVSHGEQILALVNAIIDSISSIAKGAIGAAAAWVEKTLARTIPVIIGFLAALLGVGGISEKIKEIIEAIRKPINEAIDWVINKAVDLVKAVGGLLGFGKKDEVAKTDDPEHDAKVTAGLAAIDEEEKKYLKDGKLTFEHANEVAKSVKKDHPVFQSITVVSHGGRWSYQYVGSKGEHEGSPTEISVQSDKFLVFKAGNKTVTVRSSDTGDEAQFKEEASYKVKISSVMKNLGLDREVAIELVGKLEGIGIHSAYDLLLQFARKEGRMRPEEFVVDQLRNQRGTPAAVATIPARETRARLVNLGEEEVGGRSREPLSEFALVFRGYPGEWQERHNPAANMTEYIHESSSPSVMALGAIQVNASGEVVRILETSIPEGEAKLIELMRKAGWKFAKPGSAD